MIEEGWNYNPTDFKNSKTVCKENKEYFYTKVQSKLSHVALKTLNKRNQDNIEASCKNNALFMGKPVLFKKMLRSATSVKSTDYALREIADQNKTKDRAGILECRSLPSNLGTEPFLECECILYAYYPGGEKKLSKL
jgi:hypothetical protein